MDWRPRLNQPDRELGTGDPTGLILLGLSMGMLRLSIFGEDWYELLNRALSTLGEGEVLSAFWLGDDDTNLASRSAEADWFDGDREGSNSANTAESWVRGGCFANGTRHERVDVVEDTLVRLCLVPLVLI